MENTCPKVEKCPIFINNVLTIENAARAYKSLYCTAGAAKYTTCKRYLVSNKIGKCPPEILPNSTKSVEEIMEKISV